MNKDSLLSRLKELETAKENMVNNLNILVGMINEAQYWISRLDVPTPAPVTAHAVPPQIGTKLRKYKEAKLNGSVKAE